MLDKVKPEKELEPELSTEFINEVFGWSKDTLRSQFITMVKRYIAIKAELDMAKNKRIIMPK